MYLSTRLTYSRKLKEGGLEILEILEILEEHNTLCMLHDHASGMLRVIVCLACFSN